jgi:hypothetical protein
MRGMVTPGVVLLHDNALLHVSTVARTRALLEHFNWELFVHPPYSPNLAPNDYHLFAYLNKWLVSQRFNNNGGLIERVKTWLSSQVVDFFDTDKQKLISRYKRLNSRGDYIEEQLKPVRIFRNNKTVFLIACFVNSSPGGYIRNSPHIF